MIKKTKKKLSESVYLKNVTKTKQNKDKRKRIKRTMSNLDNTNDFENDPDVAEYEATLKRTMNLSLKDHLDKLEVWNKNQKFFFNDKKIKNISRGKCDFLTQFLCKDIRDIINKNFQILKQKN